MCPRTMCCSESCNCGARKRCAAKPTACIFNDQPESLWPSTAGSNSKSLVRKLGTAKSRGGIFSGNVPVLTVLLLLALLMLQPPVAVDTDA